MRELVDEAIVDLCEKFEKGGYMPSPLLDLGVLVASADGKVDEKERETLAEIFQSLLETKLSADIVGHLIAASLEVIEEAGVEPRARLVGEILRDCDAVRPGLLVATAVALASEGLSASERRVIDAIARAGGIEEAEVEEVVRELSEVAPAERGPDSLRAGKS
jgi:tellurite resistance protein